MKAALICLGLTLVAAGPALAQNALPPIPGTICPDGSDPAITGIGCTQPTFRNAIDEGLNSSVQRRKPDVTVPNDPLGNSIGNGNPAIGQQNTFGNRGIQLPPIR